MSNFFKHLKTIRAHRKYVRKACFKMGLFWQGLTHDLSKYSLPELSICRYYTGKNSPHQNARNELGYSPSWIHHYHCNKHHYQYWIDHSENDEAIPLLMPFKYVIEMFCDRVSACKVYNGKNYTNKDAWNYFVAKTKGHSMLHPETEYLLEKLLWALHESKNDKEFIVQYKRMYKYLKYWYGLAKLQNKDTQSQED